MLGMYTCSYDITVNSATAIENIQKAGISIYPNPVKNILKIEDTDNKIEKISVYSLSGK